MADAVMNPFAGDSPAALINWQKRQIERLEAALEEALAYLKVDEADAAQVVIEQALGEQVTA